MISSIPRVVIVAMSELQQQNLSDLSYKLPPPKFAKRLVNLDYSKN